ncbi:O-antigen ligase family protein [Agromyces archimandritae]|uniref:O-antigen ligase family protein n=1 Tax=Agromyces archimandritae TaxID=2781962 RepID=A0A975FMP4_9MICO|nr:O-antigen ligase family protein [Agromyces archimandritae]QTX05265.1 O-antigen ligase family protein [Agromyces archimandritae]
MSPPRSTAKALADFIGSARMAQALSLAIIGTGFGTHLIRSLLGWPGLIAIIAGLLVLSALSLVARWRAVEWYGILPISILVFVGWAAASVIWSDHSLSTLVRVGYLFAFGFLGVYIALMRDTIQIVRAFGDVMRLLLGLSLALEVFSGILIDLPIDFLGIEGNIAALGPIQGVFGSRNFLGFVALIALISFMIEWRTRSVQRGRTVLSTVLAAAAIILSGSPTTWIAFAAAGLATAALYGLRKAAPATRWSWQLGILAAAVVAIVAGWLLRVRIIGLLDARGEFDVRLDLWREMNRYLAQNPLEGWGWVGFWPKATDPYVWLQLGTGRQHGSGLSAWVDVYFQLGIIGLLAFIALVGLAFARSWLLASVRRSVVYVWPALMLVVLIVWSFAESFAIVEGGWMLLVVCAVKAARDMSWRDALREGRPAG